MGEEHTPGTGPRTGNVVVRRLTGLGSISVGVVTVLQLCAVGGPDRWYWQVLAVVLGTSAIGIGIVWLLIRRPSAGSIVGFAAYADVGIVAVAFLAEDRYLGLFDLTALTVVSAYLIFYLPRGAMSAHLTFVAVALVAMGAMAWSQHPGDLFGVVARTGVAALVLISLPPFLHRHQDDLRRAVRTQFQLANHDALTGLLNRRGFDALLVDAMARSHRPRVLVVVVLDLDGFKAVNDEFGHARGDEVLETLATRLARAADGSGAVARTGGEEFAIVADGPAAPRDAEEALALAEQVRAALNCDDDEIPVTASVGVSVGAGVLDRSQVQNLLDAADRAMYEAKRAGGDRVAVGTVVDR